MYIYLYFVIPLLLLPLVTTPSHSITLLYTCTCICICIFCICICICISFWSNPSPPFTPCHNPFLLNHSALHAPHPPLTYSDYRCSPIPPYSKNDSDSSRSFIFSFFSTFSPSTFFLKNFFTPIFSLSLFRLGSTLLSRGGVGGGQNSPARSPNTETYKGIDTHR